MNAEKIWDRFCHFDTYRDTRSLGSGELPAASPEELRTMQRSLEKALCAAKRAGRRAKAKGLSPNGIREVMVAEFRNRGIPDNFIPDRILDASLDLYHRSREALAASPAPARSGVDWDTTRMVGENARNLIGQVPKSVFNTAADVNDAVHPLSTIGDVIKPETNLGFDAIRVLSAQDKLARAKLLREGGSAAEIMLAERLERDAHRDQADAAIDAVQSMTALAATAGSEIVGELAVGLAAVKHAKILVDNAGDAYRTGRRAYRTHTIRNAAPDSLVLQKPASHMVRRDVHLAARSGVEATAKAVDLASDVMMLSGVGALPAAATKVGAKVLSAGGRIGAEVKDSLDASESQRLDQQARAGDRDAMRTLLEQHGGYAAQAVTLAAKSTPNDGIDPSEREFARKLLAARGLSNDAVDSSSLERTTDAVLDQMRERRSPLTFLQKIKAWWKSLWG